MPTHPFLRLAPSRRSSKLDSVQPPAGNALSDAPSTYLRAAGLQPVHWQPWGPEAFAQAQREGRPILLDIGATWCHWCHVMDRESYTDPETADLINMHFVAVKVDRDERPDIDARYQAAVSAISGQGGWPLTCFLTGDGSPFFGGTYFPHEERYGQPGFQRVLKTMAASFYNSRADVDESANSVVEAIEYSESFLTEPVPLHDAGNARSIAQALADSILQQFDPVNGGFGSQPKFPHPAVLDLLLDAVAEPGERAAGCEQAILHTLDRMAAGGVCDQLAGGFHRYAVDDRWIVPRFEKMACDNAALLRCYTRAYQTFGHARHADVAADILAWMDSHLADEARGGFYSSQEAYAPGQPVGAYYTWTRAEAAEVLHREELHLAGLYYDIGEIGDLPRDPSRNVLFRPMPLAAAAAQAGVSPESAECVLQAARGKLLAARRQRPAPAMDQAMYTAWNAQCISAYAEAGRVLKLPHAIAFARLSLDRVLSKTWRDGALSHVVAYAGPTSSPAPRGMLEDYACLGHACLDLAEAEGGDYYRTVAAALADRMLEGFYDARVGGLFDTDQTFVEVQPVLRTHRKPVQDATVPAANSTAVTLLLRLHRRQAGPQYLAAAQKTLECFAGVAQHLGLNGASFGLTLRQFARVLETP